MNNLLALLSPLFPWLIRRWILEKFLGYQIHPTARIGFAFVCPKKLIMEAHSSIDHLTVCRNLDLLHLGAHALIGKGNWIYGFPVNDSTHFTHQTDRKSQLVLGEHAAITSRHIVDCINSVTIGKFSIVGGYQSQILTHFIDFEKSIQTSAPVTIGDYCFIGTASVILGGSILPGHCIVGAKSLLNDSRTECFTLYAGVPAKAIKKLPADWKFFSRKNGFVD